MRRKSDEEFEATQSGTPVPEPPEVTVTRQASILDRNRASAERFVRAMESGEEPAPTANVRDIYKEVEDVEGVINARRRELLTEEANRRAEARAMYAAGKPVKEISALMALGISAVPDRDVILDKDGQPAGTPGYVKRHVRMVDWREVESDARPRTMQHFGYKPIRSRVDGSLLVDELGMKMEAPPEAEGTRRAFYEAHTSDMYGNVTGRRPEAPTATAVAEDANRAFGREVLKVEFEQHELKHP